MSAVRRRGAFEIHGSWITRIVKVDPRRKPERICLRCGARIGRLSTIECAYVGGLCEACDVDGGDAMRSHPDPITLPCPTCKARRMQPCKRRPAGTYHARRMPRMSARSGNV